MSEDDQALLTKLGGWRKDRMSGIEGLTVAGLLMFGKEEALREALHQYQADYREKLSDDPEVRWTDRLTLDGTWAGNLFQFYLRIIQRLAADLKLPFQLDRDLFRKGETVVHEAIREALVTADIESGVDNARMRQITGGHATDMTRLLQGLVAQKALHQEGAGRWTRYRLLDSPHTPDRSVHKGGDSVHNEDDSVHNEGDSVDKGGHSVQSATFSDQQRQLLEELATPARNHRRLSPAEMEQIILRLCRDHWLTRSQLGELLQRNADSIRSRFLTPMVARGYLRLRYPDKPNRSDQAYTTASPTTSEDTSKTTDSR